MTINSKQVYVTLDRAFEDAKSQIALVAPHSVTTKVYAWMDWRTKELRFGLEIEHSYTTLAKVEGADLQELVEEAIRRMGWQQRQDTLLLAPVVESTTAPSYNMVDDEIPS